MSAIGEFSKLPTLLMNRYYSRFKYTTHVKLVFYSKGSGLMMEMNLRPPNGQWTRRESVNMLKESSLTAVTNILSTKSNYRRAFKIFVLLFCFTGFFYQAYTFFTYYFEYPTIVDVDIEQPVLTEMPAVTFCNNNGINKNRFCSQYPSECYVADETLCAKYPSYCKANKTLVPKNSSYYKIDTMSVGDFLKVGSVDDSSLEKQGVFENVSLKGPFIRAKSFDGRGRMGCYSWLTVLDTPDDPFTVSRTSIIHAPVAYLTFNLHDDDQFIPGQKTGIYFSVHSPHLTVNPVDKGTFMKPGKLYKLYISMEKEVLLPYPYDTNCLNYTEIWLNSNRTGPRIQEMCQHKCILDTTSKFLNCSIVFGLYPHNLRICTHEEIMKNYETLTNHGWPCVLKCRDDCTKTKYKEVVKDRFISELSRSESQYQNESKLIKIEIFVEASEIITFRHRPQYLYIEAFSYIGGFIGIWLGISLIQLTDFVETLFSIWRSSYTKGNTKD